MNIDKNTAAAIACDQAPHGPTGAREAPSTKEEPKAIHGLRPFPARGGVVTNELIDKLGEDDSH